MPTPPTVYDETAKGPGLSGLLEIVRRRRVLAVLPFLFVLTAAVSLAVFLPSLWTARSLVLVNRQVIPERYVTSTVQADLEARLLTLSQEILTPQRLTQIARQYGLYRNARSTDDLVDRMRKDIRIELVEERERRSREGRSFLFTVSYTAANPVVAARVANTLSSLYIEENGRMREQQAASTSEFLEGQLKDLRDKLQNQERTITAYKEKNLGELPEQKDVNLRTLERLQQQLQALERAEVDVLLLGQLAEVLLLVGGDRALLVLQLVAQILELSLQELRGTGRLLLAHPPVLFDVERGQRVGHAGGHHGVGRRVRDG